MEFLDLRGDLLTTASWDKTLKLWDVSIGQCLQTFIGHLEVVYCSQFDDKKVVTGSGDGDLRIWDISSGDCMHVLSGHEADVYCLQFNEDVIVSGSADSTLRLWNHEGACLNILKEHVGVVRCLAIRGSHIISGGDRKKIVVWDTKTGELLNVVHRNPTLLHLMWVSDTKLITASPESPGTITTISYW
ncbi:F-box/WD repeat-containing protein 11-like [Anneissia japonica]|uniref:F-box/WD repeat-containing protein 11-like n=1 Tax=Anneissia japonica TaxID=1529436 RepID=UPI001425AAE9|nr:F-box/WD repeat-containing protein 11-like [Anneissia japonica]